MPAMVFMVVLTVASTLPATGCGPAEAAPAGSPALPTVAPPELIDPPPDPPPQNDPCEPLITEVTDVLDSGSTQCSETADCGCYGGGMGPRSGCGGIANQATLDRLAPIATRFRATECYPTVNCAPWSCMPTCEDGQCRDPGGHGGTAGRWP